MRKRCAVGAQCLTEGASVFSNCSVTYMIGSLFGFMCCSPTLSSELTVKEKNVSGLDEYFDHLIFD